MLLPVPLRVERSVVEAEVGTQVEYHGSVELGDDRLRSTVGEGDEHHVQAGRDSLPGLQRHGRIGRRQTGIEFSDRLAGLGVGGRKHDLEAGMVGAQPHEFRSGEAGSADDSYGKHCMSIRTVVYSCKCFPPPDTLPSCPRPRRWSPFR